MRLLALLILLPSLAFAQQKTDPPKNNPPDEAQQKLIFEKQERLRELLKKLQANPKLAALIPHVEIYLKGAFNIERFKEYYHKDSAKWTLSTLDEGLKRAEQLLQNQTPWLNPSTKSTTRAYRSRIDDSVQPYSVTYPADYGTEKGKKYRLDLVLHGRDGTLTEVKFLNTHNGTREAPKDRTYIQIEIFGRGNNAYRWAGEEDVFEALNHFRKTETDAGRGELLDPNRVVLRGFSMGGAGTWHLGLHHPDQFCVIGPGAGFTTTHGYIKGLPDPLATPQEECLRIYDAVRYAENARGLPVVAYSGEKDPQKAAADNIEARVKSLQINTMLHLIAPGLEHQMPAEWQKKAEVEFAKYATEGRNPSPDEISFSTYTLKYPRRDWLELRGLEKHYELAQIEGKKSAKSVSIKTKNVRVFAIREAESKQFTSIDIDGVAIPRSSVEQRFFIKKDGRWTASETEPTGLQKRPGLQGPIDDGFTDRFLVIARLESTSPSPESQFTNTIRTEFDAAWQRYMRGRLRVTSEAEIRDAELKESNLILFGKPSINPTLAKIMPQLPFKWTAETIEINGEKFDAKTHYVAMIYPNPLNPKKYVVLNSGHTFGEAEFKGTNAQLYPRWGDYAVLKMAPTEKEKTKVEVVRSGLFNEFWQFEPRK
jgi:predicted esterase